MKIEDLRLAGDILRAVSRLEILNDCVECTPIRHRISEYVVRIRLLVSEGKDREGPVRVESQMADERAQKDAQLAAAYAALDAVAQWAAKEGVAGEQLLALLLRHGVHPRA